MKVHIKILQKVLKEDKYVVHNLMWSGFYLGSNFSNDIIQNVMTLMPHKATVTEVYVTSMTIFLSDYYNTL